MAETKEDIAAERDTLREENDRLKAQLAAAGRPAGATQAQHQFVLSEGARQDLIASGVTNIDGVRRTAPEVQAMLGADQQNVDLGDTEPVDGLGSDPVKRSSIRGFDYVYPSVEAGYIDPAVAGTPGINGPPAATKGKS